MKPLRLRPLQPGRAHIYRPPMMKRMLYVDMLSADTSAFYSVPVFSLEEAFEVIAKKAEAWIEAKRAADQPAIDYAALTAQRERREATNA